MSTTRTITSFFPLSPKKKTTLSSNRRQKDPSVGAFLSPSTIYTYTCGLPPTLVKVHRPLPLSLSLSQQPNTRASISHPSRRPRSRGGCKKRKTRETGSWPTNSRPSNAHREREREANKCLLRVYIRIPFIHIHVHARCRLFPPQKPDESEREREIKVGAAPGVFPRRRWAGDVCVCICSYALRRVELRVYYMYIVEDGRAPIAMRALCDEYRYTYTMCCSVREREGGCSSHTCGVYCAGSRRCEQGMLGIKSSSDALEFLRGI